MKQILVSSLKGLEDVCISEVKDILGVKARKVSDGGVVFKTNNLKKYLNKVRIIKRACYLIKKFEFKSKKDIVERIDKTKFEFKGSFRISCNRKGNHDFKSVEVERDIGRILVSKGNKADLSNPKNIIFVDIADNKCFVGYLIKDILHKRDYRFRRNNDSIDACLAASLVKIGDVEGKHFVVSPICKDGIIGIEFYLQGIKKVCCLDNSRNNIRNAKINAKLAKAKIEFHNNDLDWLITLFNEKSVDRVVTIVAGSLRKIDFIKKDFGELFNQAKYLLKKNGKIILVGRNLSMLDDVLNVYNFKIEKEKVVFVGKEKYEILVLKP